jgi:hypothetical protein
MLRPRVGLPFKQAIKRTFADVYQVLPETVDVSWGDDTITVRCSDHNFTHKIDRDGETTLEFISEAARPGDERRRCLWDPLSAVRRLHAVRSSPR